MSTHNLIVLSDVHLGSDLVHHARPDAPARSETSVRRDRDLVALLEWYRARRNGDRPWRLVIAGDLVDFAGMSVAASPDEVETELTEEEKVNGLGSAADHTLAKLRQVAAHHRDVFVAFARFVEAGNTLVVVRGNHDLEFHWEPVQRAFCDMLRAHAPIDAGAVEFSEWFYYEEGLVYIEHGHQYDDYCSFDHVLHPVLPSDPRRSHRSLSDILLRYVVRPTRGMRESGHESASVVSYLRFASRLGVRGVYHLGRRFVIANLALLTMWREHMSEAASWMHREHERKMALLAEARKISLEKLRALASLHRPPVTRSLFRLLAGVMLDRVAFGVVALIAAIWLLAVQWTPTLGIGALVVVALLVPLAWLWRRARVAIDASAALREGAGAVAKLLPTAFVVMGHTHLPEVRRHPSRDGDGVYVNLGAWAEEDSEDGEPTTLPATRTHFVVHHVDGRPVAALMSWHDEGPTRFLSGLEADDDAPPVSRA